MENDKKTPCLLDVSGLLRGEIREQTFDVLLTPELTSPDIRITGSSRIFGKAVNYSGYMEFSCQIECPYETHCSRCLLPLERTLSVTYTVPMAQTLENMDNDEYMITQDGIIDLEEVVRENFFLNLPLSHLCREECKGLCPKCGHDRNEGDCGCDLREKDPRWDKLKDFFNEDE